MMRSLVRRMMTFHGAPLTAVKMADASGTKLSEEKESEIALKKRQKRPWEDLRRSGKIGITSELPETLGFYDISAARREQREPPAGKTSGLPKSKPRCYNRTTSGIF